MILNPRKMQVSPLEMENKYYQPPTIWFGTDWYWYVSNKTPNDNKNMAMKSEN